MTIHQSNSSPTFSVIIPNFNGGSTLARAIDSILCQTQPAHEIIIIDDGSTDNSKEVAQQFGTKIRYIYQNNAGVSAARNHGAQIATGDWLAFLDADDVFLPNRLKVHSDWINKETDLDFLCGDQEYRNPQGELLYRSLDHCLAGKLLINKFPGQIEIPMCAEDFEQFIADGFGEIRTLSVPRSTFLSLGGFPLGKKIGEDLHFVIRLCASCKKAGVVNLPLAIYYIYPNSVLRANILQAQIGFVETLESLRLELMQAPIGIYRGYRTKLRQARLNLAYAYLRENRKRDAVKSVLPSHLFDANLSTVRDVLSILRGLPKQA